MRPFAAPSHGKSQPMARRLGAPTHRQSVTRTPPCVGVGRNPPTDWSDMYPSAQSLNGFYQLHVAAALREDASAAMGGHGSMISIAMASCFLGRVTVMTYTRRISTIGILHGNVESDRVPSK